MNCRLTIILLATLCPALIQNAPAVEVTGITGGSQPHVEMQPSLAMNYIIHLEGDFNELAEVSLFGGSFAPGGWAFAAGQLMTIAQNTSLFSKIGNNYGGDGKVTFALPDLRGRTVIGDGQGPGLTDRLNGEQVGSEHVTLTQAQMPAHDHTLPWGDVTSATGGSQPHANMQPSLAMNYTVSLDGMYPDQVNQLDEIPFLGQVRLFAGGFSTPPGYASADGQLMSTKIDDALFSILADRYGGDGKASFALPDLRGRTVIGAGQGPGLTDRLLAEQLGVEDVILTEGQIPAHNHTLPPSADLTGDTGGSQPHDNMQPSLALNYIISTSGIFPSREDDNGQPLLGQVMLFGGDFEPLGWQFCDGQLLPIAQNTALFAILGTTYGGNGQTTFALPDLRGRTVIGAGQGPGLSDRVPGEVLGTETSTLTLANLPEHDHAYVPEPATWMLAASGLLALVLHGWRRRGALRDRR